MPLPILPTTLVGSFPQPDWLIDREKLSKQVPRVNANLWLPKPSELELKQDQATVEAIRDQESVGLDIITEARIGVTDAMTGTTVVVPTVEGEHEVELRAGVQPGEQIRLKGQGFPNVQGRGKGDQVVLVDVRIPRITSDEGKAAMQPLADHLGEHGDDGE